MPQSNREAPGINFCSCLQRFVKSFSFGEATLTHSIKGKPMLPKSSAVGVVYSDASETGFGGYFVQCSQDLVSGTWSHKEVRTSSAFGEILAVKYVLLSLLDQLSGLTVKWFR